jgi:hypothetical protein
MPIGAIGPREGALMSDSYETTSPSGPGVHPSNASGKIDAAKHEAAEVKDTATAQAKDVAEAVKDEASTVFGEAKYQAKDLYAQTQRELEDQASTQQERVAVGLRSISHELGTMATNSDGGVASDLVQQVASRLASASTWLGDRDPSSVLAEAKRFARRKPGTFILAAAVAGVVVGRLTRALATNTSDDKADLNTATPPPVPLPAPALVEPDPWAPTAVSGSASDAGSPVYSQTASSRPDILGEDGDERRDTF